MVPGLQDDHFVPVDKAELGAHERCWLSLSAALICSYYVGRHLRRHLPGTPLSGCSDEVDGDDVGDEAKEESGSVGTPAP